MNFPSYYYKGFDNWDRQFGRTKAAVPRLRRALGAASPPTAETCRP